MSAVSIPPITPDIDYLKGLIRSIVREELELLKGSFVGLEKEDTKLLDNYMVQSEHKVLKRLQTLEVTTGLLDKDYLEEDIETISEKIEKLEAYVVTEESVTQKTKNEKRAEFFVKTIPKGKVTPSLDREIKMKDFRQWLANVPEELKAKSNTNLRKLKSDFFKLLEKLYPDKFSAKQESHGNREWKLIVQSVT